MLSTNLIKIGDSGMGYFVYSTALTSDATHLSLASTLLADDGTFYFGSAYQLNKIDVNTFEISGIRTNTNIPIVTNSSSMYWSNSYGLVTSYVAANLYVTASSLSVDNASYSNILSIDAPGTTSPGRELAFSEDAFGNLYLGSQTAIVKTNSDKVLQWSLNFSNSTYRAYIVDNSANVYMYGFIFDTVYVPIVVKINNLGVVQWIKRITPPSGAGASTGVNFGTIKCLDIDTNGDIYVSLRYGSSSNFVSLLKINSSGTTQWQRTLSVSTVTDNIPAVKVIGNDVLLSYRSSSNYVLVCYSNSGSILWSRSISRASFSTASSSVQISSSSSDSTSFAIALPFQISISGTNQYSSFVAKLPADGSLTGTYGGFSYSTASVTDSAGSHVITDHSLTSTSDYTVATVSTSAAILISGSFQSIQ